VPDDEPHLIGTERTVTLDRRDLVAALDRTDAPVVFEGDIHWSDELRARLEGPSAGSAERVDRVDADD
jgi:hypothetical protein